MSPHFYKYTTIGLAGFIVVVAIFYTMAFVVPFLYSSVNNQPHALEGIPEQWAVHTWSDGQEEAHYNALATDCTLNISKTGTAKDKIVFVTSLVCEHEDGSTHHVTRGENLGNEERSFRTEPADFEFTMPVETCGVSFWYAVDWHLVGAEDIDSDIRCTRQVTP